MENLSGTPGAIAARQWRKENPEKSAEYSRNWKARNPEKNKESRLKYRINNSERIKESALLRRRNNPEKQIFAAAQTRARQNAWEIDITWEDIFIPEFCPLLDIPLFVSETGKHGDNSPSLDRIDSSKGYIRGNIWVISWKANRMKTDSTFQEMTIMAHNWLKLFPES